MRKALSGLRVVEFGQLIAVPYATKLLGDMGAEIIRIESCDRLDMYRTLSFYGNNADGDYWNKAANFYEQNRNKLSATLDLTDNGSLESLRQLISLSDVFIQNFTPRVLKKFALEYEDVRIIKPDIVMVSSTGYGHVGPWSNYGAIGYTTEAASGLAHMTGYIDGPPMLPEIPYADYTAAEHTAYAIMVALIHRSHTGQGQFIDVSQSETVTSTIPEAILDYTFNGRISDRMGNSDAEMIPHGCFRCRGEAAWIAIAIDSNDSWDRFCRVLGKNEWYSDDRFYNPTLRRKHESILNNEINKETSQWDARELMRSLQANGVAAGVVLDGSELLFDPHLNERSFFEIQHHPASTNMPPLPYASRPWKFSKTPGRLNSSAPTLGEHNEFILCEILGLDKISFERLKTVGSVGNEPNHNIPPVVLSFEEQQKRGLVVRRDGDYKERLSDKFGAERDNGD